VKIRRLSINGFGPFSDREFGPLSPGLNVLHGPNEAGKSALRAFIRAVLFGFVTGHASARDRELYEYPPLAGGTEGGLIELEGEDGSVFTVERYRRKPAPAAGEIAVARNGSTGGQSLLDELLHPVDERVYQNVYSIALEELQGLDGEIRGRIAAAGLGAVGDVEGVRRRLKTELSSAQRVLGTSRTENREVRREYEAAQAELEGYEALVARRRDLDRSVESVRAEIAKARERLTRLDVLRSSRDNWNRMQEVQRQMEDLPRLEFLPARPVVRLDEAEGRCREVERLTREGDQVESERQQDLESLAADLAPELHTESVSRLIARQSEYGNAVRDIESVRAQARSNEERLQQGLASLGPNWDAAALESFDDSLATRNALERLEETMANAANRLETAERDAGQMRTAHEAARRTAEETGDSLTTLGPVPVGSAEQLSRHRGTLNRLRALAAGRPEAQRDLDEAARRLATAEGDRRARVVMAVQLGVSAAVTAAGIVVAVMSIQLGEAKVAQMGYAIAAVGGLGLLTSASFLLWPFRRRRTDADPSESSVPTDEGSADAAGT